MRLIGVLLCCVTILISHAFITYVLHFQRFAYGGSSALNAGPSATHQWLGLEHQFVSRRMTCMLGGLVQLRAGNVPALM